MTARRRAAGILVLALAVLGALGVAGTPVPARAAVPGGLTPAGGVYAAPILDWTRDGINAYSTRLGSTPAAFGQSVNYPMTGQDEVYLTEFVQQVAGRGTLGLLDVVPLAPLTTLTAGNADRLAATLAQLHQDFGTDFHVRFAPEMNASWKPWGLQPVAYVAAFRTFAAALHRALPRSAAVTVWSPAYGAGYPFLDAPGAVQPSGPRSMAPLDTNGDGQVDDADDPYGPYYPGDDAVDWVGLNTLEYRPPGPVNALPPAHLLDGELAGTIGYSIPAGSGRDFLARFGPSRRHRAVIETGAPFDPAAAPGPGEPAIKKAWAQQAFGGQLHTRFPAVGVIAYPERVEPDPRRGTAALDWRATSTPALAKALRTALRDGGVRSGPILTVHDLQTGNTAAAESFGTRMGTPMDWTVIAAAGLATLYVLALLAYRLRPQWRYPAWARGRDRRLDGMRGGIMVHVVFTHLAVAGPLSFFMLNIVGSVTGAELFVLLSGLVLGMVHPVAVARVGAWAAAARPLRRAAKLYAAALAVVLTVFALSFVPRLNTTVVTTFTDRGTGAAGSQAAGHTYDLYPNAHHLLDYPPPGYVVHDLLMLRLGPWPINILGLYIVLSLTVPMLVWALRRGLWLPVLAASWAVYGVSQVWHGHLFHSQFEDPFPLLTWQLPFVHGLVVGFHRERVVEALRRGVGLVLVSVYVVGYAAALGALWLAHRGWLSIPGFDPASYDGVYGHLYSRVFLQPGRLLDLVLVVLVSYTVLTAFWRPYARWIARWVEPFGRHSLFVFVMHTFVLVALFSVPRFDLGGAWQGTVADLAALTVLWLLLRWRYGPSRPPEEAPPPVPDRSVQPEPTLVITAAHPR